MVVVQRYGDIAGGGERGVLLALGDASQRDDIAPIGHLHAQRAGQHERRGPRALDLQFRHDSTTHGVIEASRSMAFQEYEDALATSRTLWRLHCR